MKIKIMYPNEKGKIELTKEELEKLLNESYSEGYSDGRYYHNGYICYGNTTTTPYLNYSDVTCASEPWSNCKDNCLSSFNVTGKTADGIASSTTTDSNAWCSGKTETIEICNINGIGVVKTNEV